MKKQKRDWVSIILKSLMTFSAICYLTIFIGEIAPPYDGGIIGGFFIFYLFILFLIGFYFSWKNDFLASGTFIILWYMILVLVGFFIWSEGGMVIGLGFPVFLIGIIMLIKGIIKKKRRRK